MSTSTDYALKGVLIIVCHPRIPAARWIVHEAVSFEEARGAIAEASCTGSVGMSCITQDGTTGKKTVNAIVQRVCYQCGEPAQAYGSCHDSTFADSLRPKVDVLAVPGTAPAVHTNATIRALREAGEI